MEQIVAVRQTRTKRTHLVPGSVGLNRIDTANIITRLLVVSADVAHPHRLPGGRSCFERQRRAGNGVLIGRDSRIALIAGQRDVVRGAAGRMISVQPAQNENVESIAVAEFPVRRRVVCRCGGRVADRE